MTKRLAAGALAIIATLVISAQVAAHDPAPAPTTTTVTTTVTTPVAPCDDPSCPPWPSLDQGDTE
ncbi:hypothetical protein HOU24_gp54 [Corynebacterium phage SamW]|uniref:Uncharacterized protein n=3 Tax=Samwavirus samW TaxID=2734273 RepID=A0A385UH98_9CAUD|nr:hypothetical protein HOU24_gp54 [Corynebacterium phage SamW]YP_009849034.1 hypothetical protein HWC46_gp55 [Corynebacterium phage Lederberg]AYB70536.1 hypothetical protein SAMW_54 [Corynebacterium phage SamW]AYQ98831.1 hypothetical protein TROY_54 [Corynebacterium phage Troy]QDF20102.1 hypothetical protein SEA_LEDERBERG_55 [Corynebacterium phage Lederberg]